MTIISKATKQEFELLFCRVLDCYFATILHLFVILK